MRTVITIIITLLCYYSCKSNETDNGRLIKLIDDLKVIDTTFEILVDSNGSVIDTISMRQHKQDNNGNEVFRQTTSFGNNKMVVKDYYRRKGELFYSITETAEGSFSRYQNWEKDNRVTHAIIVHYRKEGPDTLKMNFNYELSKDGKIKKMIIYEAGGPAIGQTYYNQYGKPIVEYHFLDSDTLSETKYEYEKDRLKSEKTIDKRKQTETVRHFAEERFVTVIEVYVRDTLTHKTVFRRDSNNNILSTKVK